MYNPGMLSHQQEKNEIEGKKQIILNPSDAQKHNFESADFLENEVWGVDILISSGDGKVKKKVQTYISYRRMHLVSQFPLIYCG